MNQQINAIKQLLETNNAIATVIESILVESIGENASWGNSSLIPELRDAVNWQHIESKDVLIPVLQKLWRSRIELNDAKHHAEIADLDGFEPLLEGRNTEIENLKLALDIAKKPADDLVMECDQLRRDLRERDRIISVLDTVVDSLRLDIKDQDQSISLLKTQIKGFEPALELANSKAIAEEAKKLKGANLKDFSFNDIPY